MFIRISYLPLSWATSNSPSPLPYFLKVHFNIIFFYTSSSSKIFSSKFFTKSLHASFFLQVIAPRPAHVTILELITRKSKVWRGVEIALPPVMYSTSILCYFIPLRPKYICHYALHKHFQLVFFSQCEGPSFTPVQATGGSLFCIF